MDARNRVDRIVHVDTSIGTVPLVARFTRLLI